MSATSAEDQISNWAAGTYGITAYAPPRSSAGAQASPTITTGTSTTSVPVNDSGMLGATATMPAQAGTSPWTKVASPTTGGMSAPTSYPATTPAPTPTIPGLSSVSATNATAINPSSIATRTIDPGTETVAGQVNKITAENSPVLQQAQAQAMRVAAGRGMLNSAMAASAGENAVIGQATNMAATDAAAYKSAADYNAAAQNQATMWNADQASQLQRLDLQLQDAAANRAQSMSLAQMQDATTRYQAEMSANTSRYNTDAAYRQQMDSQKMGLANNVIQNMDLSPDRKAALLQALGLGTMARAGQAGSGLAGAVYVIDSTSSDLQSAFIHDFYNGITS
jgi:hypothetical protein